MAMIRVLGMVLAVTSTAGVLAQNMVVNPSAEEVGLDGQPAGWGLHVGCGNAKLTVSRDERRSGEASACLELTEWDEQGAGENAKGPTWVNASIMLAEHAAYTALDALPCEPGVTYAFSFWYKGTVKSAVVQVFV